MRYDTIVFDLDGTLLDSRPGIETSMRHAIASAGLQAPEDLRWAIGPPFTETAARLFGLPRSDPKVQVIAKAYREHYGEVGIHMSAVYPGIPEALDRLADRTLYIATAKRTHFAVRMLEANGLAPRFRRIYGSEPGGLLDAKTDLLRHVAAEERFDAARTCMVGDREHDALGAGANGLAFLGVAWGYGSTEEFHAAGATRICRDPAELVADLS